MIVLLPAFIGWTDTNKQHKPGRHTVYVISPVRHTYTPQWESTKTNRHTQWVRHGQDPQSINIFKWVTASVGDASFWRPQSKCTHTATASLLWTHTGIHTQCLLFQYISVGSKTNQPKLVSGHQTQGDRALSSGQWFIHHVGLKLYLPLASKSPYTIFLYLLSLEMYIKEPAPNAKVHYGVNSGEQAGLLRLGLGLGLANTQPCP